MFFKRSKSTPLTLSDGGPSSATEEIDIGPLLDAFGQLLSAYTQGGFDLPGRPASEVTAALEPWRLHAVLGMPVDGSEHSSLGNRNFNGAARAFAEVRRVEKRLVESALTDLRECLWTCVNRVHVAVQADIEADSATATQMKRVQVAIQRLETGAVKDEVLQAISSIEHISRTRRDQQHASFTQLAERVNSLATELEEVRRESETDVLTGLGNRKRFDVAIERALHLHAISRTPLSLLIMDLDGLKQINDTLGHPAGDSVLANFAVNLSKVFLHDTDVLCRIGGDEFVALLPGTKLDLAERMANRLVENVAALEPIDGPDSPRVGVSVGFSEMRTGEGLTSWISRTDAALYEAKTSGRGRAIAA